MIKAICWMQICSHDFVEQSTHQLFLKAQQLRPSRSPASEDWKPSDWRALKILRMWCHPGMGGNTPISLMNITSCPALTQPEKNRFVSISWRLCYLIYPQFGMNKTTLVRLMGQKSSTSLREIHTLQIMWMFFQNHITYFPLCTGDGEISEPSTSTPPKFNMTTYLPRPMIFGI